MRRAYVSEDNWLDPCDKIFENKSGVDENNYLCKLSDFNMTANLGKGAYGKVVKVKSKETEEEYAIKIIAKNFVKNYGMVDQLKNEINIMSTQHHENIIDLRTYFEDNFNIYIVLELAEDKHLYGRLKSMGNFEELEAADIIYQILKAVHYLHSQAPPIIHRDIKAENIIFIGSVVKLADFGWANMKTQQRNTFCGTPDYLAPEMILGKGHNEKLDIWTIGILCYELLNGCAPFTPKPKAGNQKNAKKELEENILKNDIEFVSIGKMCSKEAKEIIRQMLTKDYRKRPSAEYLLRHDFFKKLLQNKKETINNNKKTQANTGFLNDKSVTPESKEQGIDKGKDAAKAYKESKLSNNSYETYFNNLSYSKCFDSKSTEMQKSRVMEQKKGINPLKNPLLADTDNVNTSRQCKIGPAFVQVNSINKLGPKIIEDDDDDQLFNDDPFTVDITKIPTDKHKIYIQKPNLNQNQPNDFTKVEKFNTRFSEGHKNNSLSMVVESNTKEDYSIAKTKKNEVSTIKEELSKLKQEYEKDSKDLKQENQALDQKVQELTQKLKIIGSKILKENGRDVTQERLDELVLLEGKYTDLYKDFQNQMNELTKYEELQVVKETLAKLVQDRDLECGRLENELSITKNDLNSKNLQNEKLNNQIDLDNSLFMKNSYEYETKIKRLEEQLLNKDKELKSISGKVIKNDSNPFMNMASIELRDFDINIKSKINDAVKVINYLFESEEVASNQVNEFDKLKKEFQTYRIDKESEVSSLLLKISMFENKMEMSKDEKYVSELVDLKKQYDNQIEQYKESYNKNNEKICEGLKDENYQRQLIFENGNLKAKICDQETILLITKGELPNQSAIST